MAESNQTFFNTPTSIFDLRQVNFRTSLETAYEPA